MGYGRNLSLRSITGLTLLVSAAAGGGLLAAQVGSAGADTQTITLGSTNGTPSQNICGSGSNCTYVPFHLNLSSPELQVPVDGTVTGFSVNSGSAGNRVELRVLRPAGNGSYTAESTSPPATLSTGINTFPASLPVRAGDVLGLDNADSALLFDTSDATYITAYYQPALADGATAPPTATANGYRLLLSATVQASTTTTTTTTTTTSSTTNAGPPPPVTAPSLTQVAQSHRVWREGNSLGHFSSTRRVPVGTTYSFTLDQTAHVRFAFSQLLPGRSVKRRCVTPTSGNRSHPRCTRKVLRGVLSFAARAGVHHLAFQGRVSRTRRLPTGRYGLVITATGSNGDRSAPRTLQFKIV